MNCEYKTKSGIQCKHNTLGNLNYCYLKSHHEDMPSYHETVDKLKKEFELSTISIDSFLVCNITSDGACAYRCMVRALYDIKQYQDIHIYSDSIYADQLIRLINENINLCPLIETQLARIMQQLIREWIVSNKNKDIENMEYTLENYVTTCHDIDHIEEYDELYKIFAGDDDFIKVETGRYYQRGRNAGKPIMKKIQIDDRWGASPEHYAFVNIFNVCLSIYSLKRFDTRFCKIVKGNLKGLPSRLSLLQVFNDNIEQPRVNFLLTDKQAGHYSYLQQKS